MKKEDFFELKWVKGGYRENIPQTEICKEAKIFLLHFFSVSIRA